MLRFKSSWLSRSISYTTAVLCGLGSFLKQLIAAFVIGPVDVFNISLSVLMISAVILFALTFGGESGLGILWILLLAFWIIMLVGVFSTAGWILHEAVPELPERFLRWIPTDKVEFDVTRRTAVHASALKSFTR